MTTTTAPVANLRETRKLAAAEKKKAAAAKAQPKAPATKKAPTAKKAAAKPAEKATGSKLRCTLDRERTPKGAEQHAETGSATYRCCDIHRVHNIGEQHRHLLVLRLGSGWRG